MMVLFTALIQVLAKQSLFQVCKTSIMYSQSFHRGELLLAWTNSRKEGPLNTI